MEIIIQNKQRRYKLDIAKLEAMADKLSRAVFDNLKKDKLKRINNVGILEKFSLLSLIIVSPSAIRKLNKQWLHKDKETDVLSFPLVDLATFDPKSEFSNFGSSYKNSHNGKDKINAVKEESFQFELGEIFISYEQAIKQAKEYNHSLERELAFLFVHGLLHILGFDHQSKAEEKEMFGRQKEILVKAGYARG